MGMKRIVKIFLIVIVVVAASFAGLFFTLTHNVKGPPTYTYTPGGTPPPEVHGWVSPNAYFSPVYKIKPGMTIEHVIVYEKASPHDLATVWLLFRSVEEEGLIEYYINNERWGLSYISEEVVRGEIVASCCAVPWMETPQRETIQTVKSISYEGEFQFVFIVLIEKPD
jgi:hypothetical protein